ncbi:MAG: DUF2760 domain-containing protein [Pseudomonadales bacterium]|nr:DUF2760 domain-containing protein [Pseudomonadales bacterium]
MNIDLANIPTTLDIAHLCLAFTAVLFLILFVVKKPATAAQVDAAQPTPAPTPEPVQKVETKPATVQLKESGPEAALQLLTLLQQDARFIDFIQEDLTSYSDADVGAAARVVHEGSKKTLNSYFELAAIRPEDEESRITLEEGFNAAEVRLTGNVVGTAPFTGTLIHKGWRITQTKLPKLAPGHDASIIAAAEVEL